MWIFSCPSTVYGKLFFSPLNDLGTLIDKQLTIMYGFILGLSNLFHSSVYLSLCHYILITLSFQSEQNVLITVNLKWGCVSSPTFFFKIASLILYPLQFHMNFRITLTISEKQAFRILIEITLNLQINLGNLLS